MAINSRKKGQVGERELAKLFSAWWGEPNSFGRTPGSGSFATRLRKYGKQEDDFRGDLFGPQTCLLHVEAKRDEALDFESVLCGTGRKLFESYWEQATGDCPDGKFPILVFRRNRREWIVCLKQDESQFSSAASSFDSGKFVAKIGGPNRLMMLLSDFLLAVKPSICGKQEVA